MVEPRGNSTVERAQVFVIDASVALKWYVSEEDRDKALKVRRDYVEGKIDLASPALILYEVFNALRYHPGLPPGDIARYASSLLDMQMDLRLPSGDTNKAAAELAVKEGISGYDAHYIAVAQTMRARLITSDTMLMDKLSNETKKSVKLLREYA
jgi:predicted nucleic acid-binding protein